MHPNLSNMVKQQMLKITKLQKTRRTQEVLCGLILDEIDGDSNVPNLIRLAAKKKYSIIRKVRI